MNTSQGFDLSTIQAIGPDSVGQLVKIQLHTQRLFMTCQAYPLDEQARFHLLSLQHNTLVAIEVTLAHCEGRIVPQQRKETDVILSVCIAEFEQMAHALRSFYESKSHNMPDFGMLGDWSGDRVVYPIGKSTRHGTAAETPKPVEKKRSHLTVVK